MASFLLLILLAVVLLSGGHKLSQTQTTCPAPLLGLFLPFPSLACLPCLARLVGLLPMARRCSPYAAPPPFAASPCRRRFSSNNNQRSLKPLFSPVFLLGDTVDIGLSGYIHTLNHVILFLFAIIAFGNT